jgi:hypothetical protein
MKGEEEEEIGKVRRNENVNEIGILLTRYEE